MKISNGVDKKIPIILIGIILVLGVIFLFSKGKNNQTKENSGIILFYGTGCPHCAKVEEYLKENDVESKIKFENKEVYQNQGNLNLLIEKAKKCGIKENEVGVPFLWDGSKCIIGDGDIINFFKQKISKS